MAAHLQLGGHAGQLQIVGAIHLHRQAGLGTQAATPVEATTAQRKAGAVGGGIAQFVAAALLVVRHAGAGVAILVLGLGAQRCAVAVIVVAAQVHGGLAVQCIHFLAQRLAGAVVHIRARVLRLAHIHGVAALRAADVAALQAGQAEVDEDAAVAAVARAALGGLLPYAHAGGDAELLPALHAAVAGLPGAGEVGVTAVARLPRQQRVEHGHRVVGVGGEHGASAPGLAAGVGDVGIATANGQ